MTKDLMKDLARRFRTAADSLDRMHKDLFQSPTGGRVKGTKKRATQTVIPAQDKPKVHWMKRPENAAKVRRIVRRMHAAKQAK